MLALATNVYYPRWSMTEETVARAHALLEDDDVDTDDQARAGRRDVGPGASPGEREGRSRLMTSASRTSSARPRRPGPTVRSRVTEHGERPRAPP